VILGLQTGATLVRDGGRYGAFRAPEFRRAASFYVSLFADGLAPRVTNAQVSNVYQQFAAGDFAMWVTGPWNLGEFRHRLPAERQDLWSTAPLPAPGPVPGAPGLSIAGGSSLAVFKASRRKDDAWKVVEFLSAPEQQLRFYALSGDLPARIRAWEDPALRDDLKAHAFAEQLRHVVAAPKLPEWESIATRVLERMESVIRGRVPLDDALAALDADADRILEKRRWILDGAGKPRAR
jgi:multiple sugar transport system substrate-binding protein